MPTLFLTEDEVRELIDMETSIEVVEESFRQLAQRGAVNVPRARAIAPGIVLHTMSGAAEYLGLAGWKAYSSTKGGLRFHVAVYNISDGEMVALMQANYLGQLRTGAASGVATRYMARPDAKVVGMFGTGLQARTQLKAVCAVRNVERAEVYSRNEQRCARAAEEMAEDCETDVVAVRSPDQAAADKDIVICASKSGTPVFDGRLLRDGTHLNVMGSNFLAKTEIDVTTVERADRIVCDSIEQCKLEAGDFVQALADGVTAWDEMYELADVVAGKEPGRNRTEDVTLFKSVGLGLEDVAMAAEIVRRARQQGRGRELDL